MNKNAILVQRVNDSTGKKEWALVSKNKKRILEWYGVKRPSSERVKQTENRVQMFKHIKKAIDELENLLLSELKEPEEKKDDEDIKLKKLTLPIPSTMFNNTYNN